MNREILFCGKRKDNGNWIIGYYFEREEKCFITIDTYPIDEPYNKAPMRIIAVEVIPETVGDYTGASDKNDKRIFEDDILQNSSGIFVVFWDEHFLHWCTKNEKGHGCFALRTLVSDKKRPCEVVGNIHDNPELLEAGK